MFCKELACRIWTHCKTSNCKDENEFWNWSQSLESKVSILKSFSFIIMYIWFWGTFQHLGLFWIFSFLLVYYYSSCKTRASQATSRACDHLLPRCPRVLGAWVGHIDERFEFNRRCRSAHSPNLSIRFSTRRFVKLFVKPFKPIVSFLELICQIFSCINKSKLGNFGNFCFPSVNLIIVIIYYYYLEKYPIKTNHVMTFKWFFSLHCSILHVFGWGQWFFFCLGDEFLASWLKKKN
jgi:hypothetical protein